MKYNLLNVLLLNERALNESTRAEMLELQALLIDRVEYSDDVDFSLQETADFGVVIDLVYKSDKCRIVKMIRKTVGNTSHVYGIKVPSASLKISTTVEGLIGDVHDWLITNWRLD